MQPVRVAGALQFKCVRCDSARSDIHVGGPYRVAVVCKVGVPAFGPPLALPGTFDMATQRELFREFMLTKRTALAIHAHDPRDR